jgi:hypothetical protein
MILGDAKKTNMPASATRGLIGSLLSGALAAVMLPTSADAIKIPGTDPGSVYDYIATPAFGQGAQKFYLDSIASNASRQKLISQAKDDCGGRYEGTAVNLVELSHQIKTDKHPPDHPGTTYAMGYGTEAITHWLVVETFSCSFAGGHAQSVLHAAFLTGTESELVTYNYVHDKLSGQPAVTGVKRVYKIDADALSDRYGVPYPQQ